jgi:hypothetical protein
MGRQLQLATNTVVKPAVLVIVGNSIRSQPGCNHLVRHLALVTMCYFDIGSTFTALG